MYIRDIPGLLCFSCLSCFLSILFSKTYNSHLLFKLDISSITLFEMSKAYSDIKINNPFPESAVPLPNFRNWSTFSGRSRWMQWGLVFRLMGDQIAAKMGALAGLQWMFIYLWKKLVINTSSRTPSTVWKLDPQFESVKYLGSNWHDFSWARRAEDIPYLWTVFALNYKVAVDWHWLLRQELGDPAM